MGMVVSWRCSEDWTGAAAPGREAPFAAGARWMGDSGLAKAGTGEVALGLMRMGVNSCSRAATAAALSKPTPRGRSSCCDGVRCSSEEWREGPFRAGDEARCGRLRPAFRAEQGGAAPAVAGASLSTELVPTVPDKADGVLQL